MATLPVRQRAFVDFGSESPAATASGQQLLARAHRFTVEWLTFGVGEPRTFASSKESLVIVSDGLVRVHSSGERFEIPTDAVAIVPAGTHELQGEAGSRCAVIASQRSDLRGRHLLNEGDYADDPEFMHVSTPGFRRRERLVRPQVLTFDQIKASADKPRLRMLQTETMSINVVGYLGPRDRSTLSPHSHTEFEQGSLALRGDFIHHLRTPWGSNADQWRDDEHLPAGSPSLVVVPEHVIHTSEGVHDGQHLLVDIFSPPRADFIAAGWVFNSGDYSSAGTHA
jgi:hypothetical protein